MRAREAIRLFFEAWDQEFTRPPAARPFLQRRSTPPGLLGGGV